MTVLAYFKLDVTHKGYMDALAVLREDFRAAYPDNELSVNLRHDGTEAWVKCCADSDIQEDVLLDTCPLEDVARVREQVGTEDWAGPRPRGPMRPPKA